MSNPWAQSFEDLRSPYLQEKKAKKDYDGDGKIESGAKEYRGVVHNKIQKAKGGKADGQDTSSVKEEKKSQYGMFGKTAYRGSDQKKMLAKVPNAIPKKVDEKYDDSKVSMRFGDKKQKERKEKLEKKRGMKLDKHPQFKEAKEAPRKQKGAMAYDGPNKERSMAADRLLAKAKAKRNKMKMEHHRKDEDGNTVPHEDEIINEADKKGKGSGKKDACYHKVKSRYSVWPSAYASGALVKCRKVGAKNWGNSSKKEEFDYYQMPMKSFGDMVGECWKTHEQRGMKMKGGKMVPNCVPKGSPRKEEVAYEAVKNPKLDIKETGVKNKIEINPEIKTEAAKAPVKK